MEKVRLAGISFEHMHMGDLLRYASEHPAVEIVGICDEDPARMEAAVRTFGIASDRVFTDYRACIERAKPDLVVLCPATARHGEWVQKIAPFGTHILVEKPFAASLADADAMIAAVQASRRLLAINWPLAWYPSHVTAKRLVSEGRIGRIIEVHYYDGNRGPLRHLADKVEVSEDEATRQKSESWWYQQDKGGGSLLDYLGYGVTLGTWYRDGDAPIEVTTVVDQPHGLEVDEHSITVARYVSGLSKFETRWGTFTDPWTLQPQPKCGFVLVGTAGTISSYDYEPTIRVQTTSHPENETIPVDDLPPPRQNPIQYMVEHIQTGEPLAGPLAPAIARVGQQIVDSARQSVREKRTVPLIR